MSWGWESHHKQLAGGDLSALLKGCPDGRTHVPGAADTKDHAFSATSDFSPAAMGSSRLSQLHPKPHKACPQPLASLGSCSQPPS